MPLFQAHPEFCKKMLHPKIKNQDIQYSGTGKGIHFKFYLQEQAKKKKQNTVLDKIYTIVYTCSKKEVSVCKQQFKNGEIPRE